MNRLITPALLIALTQTTPALAGNWTGKEVPRDGVIHLTNPAKPSDGATTLSPSLEWRAGGDEEDDILFGVLRDIAIDDKGNIYLLDVQLNQLHVFDRDGNFVRAIGREGEGPGEFRRPSGAFITPEGKIAVVQSMPGKVVLLNTDGTPAGDLGGAASADGGMRMYWAAGRAGNNVVLGTNDFSRGDNGLKFHNKLRLMDTKGTEKALLYEKSGTRDMANMGMDEKQSFRMPWTSGRDGRVYLADDFDAYRVNVYSPAGALERVIEREYTPRKRSAKEMEENKPRAMMRTDRGTQQINVTASPTDPAVLRMFARDDGTLWVLSGHGGFSNPKGTFVTFDVFDAKGHFTQQVAIKAEGDFARDGIQVVGDHLFVLREFRAAQVAMMGGDEKADKKEEVEAEPMSVACYRLTPTTAAKK